MKINIRTIRHYWHYFKIDNLLLGLIIPLACFGLIMLHSVSLSGKQSIHFVVAFIAMLIMAQIPPRFLQKIAPHLLIFGIISLLLIFIIGTSKGGSTRWLNLGFFTFQPSEMMKVIIPIVVATFISDTRLLSKIFATFISILTIAVVATLILLQPDLGTAILVASSGIFVLFFSGFKINIFSNKYINLSVIATLVLAFITVIWQWILKGYQKERILTIFNPESDPLGSGYHIIQSKIAIGSGGLFGKGYGLGTQSHLDFLPEHTTDFIFATISEEFGFMGVLFLLFIYILILYRCLFIAKNAQGAFAKLLAASLTMVFFIYIFANIAMVSGIFPVVGVPLPLISYGGSSVLTLMIGFGIIMSIEKHKNLH